VAFLLFFADIALRRITISREDITAARVYIAARWNDTVSSIKGSGERGEKEEIVSRLEEAKKRASQRWEK
jgi:hypothetical protein